MDEQDGLSRLNLEESLLAALVSLRSLLPDSLQLLFECFAFYLLFHVYLASVLLLTFYLFVSRHYPLQLTTCREKLFLWMLIVYHGIHSLVTRAGLEEKEEFMTEEQLADGLEEPEMELCEEENDASDEENLKTSDLFKDLHEEDFGDIETSFLEKAEFVMDYHTLQDITFREGHDF